MMSGQEREQKRSEIYHSLKVGDQVNWTRSGYRGNRMVRWMSGTVVAVGKNYLQARSNGYRYNVYLHEIDVPGAERYRW